MLALFLAHELRHPEPILDPRLLRMRLFVVPAAAIMALSAITFAGLIYIPLYIQGVLGHSATRGGLVLAPLLLASISGRFVTNWLHGHEGRTRPITLVCLALVVGGAAMLFMLTPRSTAVEIVAAMVLLGAGLGAANALLFGAALSPFALRQFGQITGALFFLRSLGGVLALGALGGILSTRFVAAFAVDLPRPYRWLLHTRFAGELENPRILLTHLNSLTVGYHPILHAMRAALATGLHQVFTVVLAMAALTFLVLAAFPVRLDAPGRTGRAAAMADGGMAGVGEWFVPEPEHPNAAVTEQVNSVWDIMCLIIYWRHGAIRFNAPAGPNLGAFNGFENGMALPTSLHDPTLAALFEQSWPLIRNRTPLDRYRAEAVARLLWQVRDLEGDLAVCGGTGDGLAILLALLLQALVIPKRVFFYHEPAAGNRLAFDGRQESSDEPAGLAEMLARHGVSDLVVTEEGHLLETLATLPTERRFCLIHIDCDNDPCTRICLSHLLPQAVTGAAVAIGHYHNSRDGARRATQEQLAARAEHAGQGHGGRLYAGPLPQAYFFADPTQAMQDNQRDTALSLAVEWSDLAVNGAYHTFLRWIASEITACYTNQYSGFTAISSRQPLRWRCPSGPIPTLGISSIRWITRHRHTRTHHLLRLPNSLARCRTDATLYATCASTQIHSRGV